MVQQLSHHSGSVSDQLSGRGGDSGDAFITKLNADGSALVYSTYLGENENHNAIGIAVDASGNAYVTGYTSGYTNSTNFPTTPGAFQPNYGGGSFDAFVAKLSPVPAAAGLDRSSLSFGNVLVNLTSPGQSVTLTNIGDDPLNITSITAGGDFALVTTATSCAYGGSTLVPGANCTIDVTFTPTATGNRTGIVTIADNAAHGPQVVQLSGTGVVGAPSISPLTLSFSDQLVGTTSASQPVTVTNTGTVALSFTSLAISIDWTESDNCLPSVAPSASCTINVSFKPTANGSLAGALTLTDNALNSPQTVNLSGTGLGATAGLSASSLTFSSQRVGTTTSAQQVTLQNTGNQALAITSISRAGANSGDFSLGQDCGSSLAAAETCHINVTFTPTARGARTAAVSLVDNAANSPQTISLSGTGIAPVANLSPNSVTFPGQFVGTTGLPENITLTNNGDMPLTISGIQASTDFGTSNGCTSSLAAGVNCTISVFFDPSAAGTRTGTLTVTDNAPGSPQTVQLSGTGKDFAMSSTTTSASVAAGQTATYSVAVTPQGGLNETVSLTCSGAPARSTCTVSPGSVPLNGTTPTSVTVSVSTTAGSMTPPAGITLPPDASGFGRLIWLWCLLALSALAALATRRRQAGLLLGLSLMMLVFWGACGGVTSRVTSVVHTPGTPAGMYSLSVTGTVTSAGSTSTQLTHEVKLSLQVN
jgi:hypothetical protein